ncbi:hypothetical protein J2Y03_004848 [Neobacillus niacini]|nr:hypothetical protein [Neobacillus niacini]
MHGEMLEHLTLNITLVPNALIALNIRKVKRYSMRLHLTHGNPISPYSPHHSNCYEHSSGTKLAVGLNVEEYLKERTTSLLHRLQWVSENIDTLEGVNIEKGRFIFRDLKKMFQKK